MRYWLHTFTVLYFQPFGSPTGLHIGRINLSLEKKINSLVETMRGVYEAVKTEKVYPACESVM